jgi:hypothetical protein
MKQLQLGFLGKPYLDSPELPARSVNHDTFGVLLGITIGLPRTNRLIPDNRALACFRLIAMSK